MRLSKCANSSAHTVRATFSISWRCSSALPPCPSYVYRWSNANKFLLMVSPMGVCFGMHREGRKKNRRPHATKPHEFFYWCW
jgi:hypothetical protein